jgi:hypothetical protein
MDPKAPDLTAPRADASAPAQPDRHDHPLTAELDADTDAPGSLSIRLNAVPTRTSPS